jgi:hypothetical protein
MAAAEDVVTVGRYPTKMGDFGFESERLMLELGESHSGEILTFSLTQETWQGNTAGGSGGYTVVVNVHTAQGTAHQHWT